MSWITGPASDPMASDEDREISDEDIQWMLRHQDRCANPEHSATDWRESLKQCELRLIDRFLDSFSDLVRQEYGELTPDSPHHWALGALKRAGAIVSELPELTDRKYVFTYNEDATDGDQTTQCGVVTGRIASASISSYLDRRELVEIITLTVGEARVMMLNADGQLHLARVSGLQCTSNDSPCDAVCMKWRMIVDFKSGLFLNGFTGTLVILPHP